MRDPKRSLLGVVLAVVLPLAAAACGGSKTESKSADSDASAESSSSAAPSAEATDSSDKSTSTTDKSTTDKSATGGGGGGKTQSGDPHVNAAEPSSTTTAAEGAKDSGALVLELSVVMRGGGKVEGEKEILDAAAEQIRASKKLALSTKNIDKPRRVEVTLTVEPAVEDKNGLTVKLRLTGVEPDGKCPVFDLDQKFSMSGKKTTSAPDVLALRQAGVKSLLVKLEDSASNVKPAANCTSFKKKS
ncbi:MAG: hypothetical protein U0271_11515 [Polyangiaceae bacterium]